MSPVAAGALAGAIVSAGFIYLEVKKLQSPAFAQIAERRVAASAERAVMQHLGQVYGLDQARIAAIASFTSRLPR